jgi:polyhydroxyalkanoate synthesis regulator phasin
MTHCVINQAAFGCKTHPQQIEEVHMAKKAIKAVEEKKGRNALYQAARKVLLASMGAVALAQEEAEDFVNKLVERGEIAERDAKKLMQEMVDKRRKVSQGGLEKRIEDILDRMNVPTKSDIEQLSAKITALSHKIDELKKSQT